jgi:hypothetical protein
MSQPDTPRSGDPLARKVVSRVWGYQVHILQTAAADRPPPVQLIQDLLECGHSIFAAAPAEARPCPCCIHASSPSPGAAS